MDPRVIVVAAVAENRVIGRDGDLPWHLKSDLGRFKALTEDNVVIMGRKTYQSIVDRLGKPLPNRTNVVLSRGDNPPGPFVRRSLAQAIHDFGDENHRDVYIIGGASLYFEALPLADELHLTTVHASPRGDVYFPSLRGGLFEQAEAKRFPADIAPGNDHDFTFSIFRRRNARVPKSYVFLPNARQPNQWAVMERIQMDGVCPFCPEHRSRYHKEQAVCETANWSLTKNQWPYVNTKHHFLIIHRRHVERLNELQDEDWRDLGVLTRLAEREFSLPSGGLGLRFGDPAGNGGTVRHLHCQLLQADITDRSDPQYRKVSLTIS